MRSTATRTAMILAIGILALIWVWSHIPLTTTGIGQPAPTTTTFSPASIRHAQDYADWCGGRVELTPGGPYTVDCDK